MYGGRMGGCRHSVSAITALIWLSGVHTVALGQFNPGTATCHPYIVDLHILGRNSINVVVVQIRQRPASYPDKLHLHLQPHSARGMCMAWETLLLQKLACRDGVLRSLSAMLLRVRYLSQLRLKKQHAEAICTYVFN